MTGKLTQHALLWGIISILSLVLMTLVFFLLKPSENASKAPSRVMTGGSALRSEEIWAEKFEVQGSLQAKRLEALEKSLDAILKLNAEKGDESEPKNSIDDLRHELKDISREPHEEGRGAPLRAPSQTFFPPTEMGGMIETGQENQNTSSKRSKGIQKTTLRLLNSRENKPLKTGDNTIPAGAFAEAILLGGVDASTSIQASSDPRPVLLRITNPGTLPRKFTSDLKGCHALAACYGDISSERVYMRLEKLTCTERKTGEILEMTVSGYVAGEDGRAGLRGAVVDRSGESMRNAMIGGFFSSMGNFLGQNSMPMTFSPVGSAMGLAQTNPLTNGDLVKHGLAKGAGGALEKYADFYIKRAEQMQPVIQVAAGRTVDIVFTQGTSVGESAERERAVKANDAKRYQQLEGTSLDSMEIKNEAQNDA